MGQQQLLLVILVTIIVGIATVVAINIFGSSAENANADAVRQDLATIATSAEGWFIKPQMLGGGNNSYAGLNFNQISFPATNILPSGLEATNPNARYVFTTVGAGVGDAAEFLVTAHPASFPFQITMTVTRAAGADGRVRAVVNTAVTTAASAYVPVVL